MKFFLKCLWITIACASLTIGCGDDDKTDEDKDDKAITAVN